MEKCIFDVGIACKLYARADPPFDPKKVNELKFDRDCWLKGVDACEIDVSTNTGYVKWNSQSASVPTEDFKAEILRAFKANGLKEGGKVNLWFKSRADSDYEKYVLEA